MHDLDTIKRMNADATQPTLDAACGVISDYLSNHTRVIERAGERRLEVLRDGVWVRVFTPDVPPAPKGFRTIRSA